MLPYLLAYAPNAIRRTRAAPSDEKPRTSAGATMRIDVAGGVSLSCRIVDGVPRPSRSILLVHGLQEDKEQMLELGRRLAGRGFRVILVDLRGHGASTGKYLGYGASESRDLHQLLDALEDRGLLVGSVGVVGYSYGANVALQLAGRDRRIKAVVLVAGFADLHQVLMGWVRRLVPGGVSLSREELHQTLVQAGRIGGFNPEDCHPLPALKRTTARVLIVHGTRDAEVPVHHAVTLHREAPEGAELHLVEGAGHAAVRSAAGEAIEGWLSCWLPSNVRERTVEQRAQLSG